MVTAEDVLNQARKWIGTAESPPNSNRVKGITDWYGMVGPWCGMAVSRWFFDAGMPLHITTDKGYAYCPYGVNYFKKIGRWSSTPSVGAIVFYGSPSESVHTGIVESFDKFNITAIEGNTAVGNDANGGSVMRRTRPRNNWIVGYGLPEYKENVKVKPMYDPPIVMEPWVASAECPTGGVWGLAASGAVYALPVGVPPFHGGMNGKPAFVGRKAASIDKELSASGEWTGYYVITATSGEKYVPKEF
jgi:hypothetical protein